MTDRETTAPPRLRLPPRKLLLFLGVVWLAGAGMLVAAEAVLRRVPVTVTLRNAIRPPIDVRGRATRSIEIGTYDNPWLHPLEEHASPFQVDRDTFYLLKSNYTVFPGHVCTVPVDSMSTNSLGLRGREVAKVAPPGSFRALCLGDSCTFGYSSDVHDDATYPGRMQQLVGVQAPDQRWEILNAGVVGYSSYQGLRLWEERLRKLRPNLVIIAFGHNDASRVEEPDAVKGARYRNLLLGVSATLLRYEVVRLFWWGALAMARQFPKTSRSKSGPEHLVPRVSPEEYERNIGAIVDQARQDGAKVVLMDLIRREDRHAIYRDVLVEVGASRGVPIFLAVEWLDRVASGAWEGGVAPAFESLARVQSAAAGKPEALWSDPVHPNALGNLWLAMGLHRFLQDKGMFPARLRSNMHPRMVAP